MAKNKKNVGVWLFVGLIIVALVIGAQLFSVVSINTPITFIADGTAGTAGGVKMMGSHGNYLLKDSNGVLTGLELNMRYVAAAYPSLDITDANINFQIDVKDSNTNISKTVLLQSKPKNTIQPYNITSVKFDGINYKLQKDRNYIISINATNVLGNSRQILYIMDSSGVMLNDAIIQPSICDDNKTYIDGNKIMRCNSTGTATTVIKTCTDGVNPNTMECYVPIVPPTVQQLDIFQYVLNIWNSIWNFIFRRN